MSQSTESDAAAAHVAQAAGVVRLTTLGAPKLERWEAVGTQPAAGDDPTAATITESGQAACLAAYLACAPGRSATRDELASLILPSGGSTEERERLRKLISRLRSQDRFGPDAFSTDGAMVRLGASVVVDRDALLAAANESDHRRAIELYTGDFFSDFSSKSAEFDDWAAGERLRLRAIFKRSAQVEVQELLTNGRFHDAKALAQRVRDLEPLDQAGWRLLIETQIASRSATLASATADELERMLADEGLSPDAETTAVVRRAKKPIEPVKDPQKAEPSSLFANLEPVGREREFRVLLDAWRDCQRGRRRVVMVTGAPGLGKTRLLFDLHARLRAGGQRVVLVRATSGGKDVAYSLAANVARSLCKLRGAGAVSPNSANALVALDPTLSSTYPNARPDNAIDDEALRRRMHALDELCASVAYEGPIALLIDDAQWCDAPSRALLERALSGSSERALLCVIAHERASGAHGEIERASATEAASGDANALLAIDGAIPLPLSALSIDDVAQLVTSVAVLPDEGWVQRFMHALHTASGGVPRHVIETLQRCLDLGVLRTTDDGWQSPDHVALERALHGGGSLAKHPPPETATTSSRQHGVPKRRPRLRTVTGLVIAATMLVVAVIAVQRRAAITPSALLPPKATEVLDIVATDRASFGRDIYSLDVSQLDSSSNASIPLAERSAKPLRFDISTTDESARPGAASEWAVVSTSLSPRGPALALISAVGRHEVLVAGAGDNIHPEWSPDGARLVFATSRWSKQGHSALAMLEPVSKSLQPLLPVNDTHTDWKPRWSPDGTHIAFLRVDWANGGEAACVGIVDGSQARCTPIEQGAQGANASWSSDSTVSVSYRVAERFRNLTFALRGNDEVSLVASSAPLEAEGTCVWSDTGVSACATSGNALRVTIPASGMDGSQPNSRVVLPPDDAKALSPRWRRRSPPAVMIDSLRVMDSPGQPIVGVPFHLRAEEWRRLDGWRRSNSLRWTSADTTIATVDSVGVVSPKRDGRVAITASLRGWRSAVRELGVRTVTAQTLIDENWRNGITSSWRSFGEPRPRILATSNGPSWNNGGDGNYSSGSYATRVLGLSDGVTIDVRLSTPITALQWQTVDVQLLLNPRLAALAAWDHRTGYFWGENRGWEESCGIRVPDGEGPVAKEFIGFGIGVKGYEAPLDPIYRSGQWYALRLQFFPDGRCGIAIDGKVLGVGQSNLTSAQAQLALWGNSVGTAMAVGPIRVRTGVSQDMKWEVPRR